VAVSPTGYNRRKPGIRSQPIAYPNEYALLLDAEDRKQLWWPHDFVAVLERNPSIANWADWAVESANFFPRVLGARFRQPSPARASSQGLVKQGRRVLTCAGQ
jgi:hypothetical protein